MGITGRGRDIRPRNFIRAVRLGVDDRNLVPLSRDIC
jgi:hypothetical protein